VELGAGCGLPGLLTAKLGASRVLLTDKDPVVLEALRLSVAANGLGDVCSVAPLAYGVDAPGADLVLAADALYLTCQVAPLVATISSALAPSAVCLLAHEPRRAWKLDADRRPVQEAEDEVLAAFLAACAAAGLAAGPLFDEHGDVCVHRIRRPP
jgi:predicted nicotinamide N-methyase